MASQLTAKDFDSSSPSCAQYDYLDIQGNDLRYGQPTTSTPALTLESNSQPPSLPSWNLGPPPIFTPPGSYNPDPPVPSTIYSGTTHSLLASSSNLRRYQSGNSSSMGMTHAPTSRSTTLPAPRTQDIREIYAPGTPTYPRRTDQRTSSSFTAPVPRRNTITSPTSAGAHVYSAPGRMDQSYSGKGQLAVPELKELISLGSLSYLTGSPKATPISIDIQGVIDKGFFQSGGEWTCYRRNYFSCVCSYTMSEPRGTWPTPPPVQFVQETTGQSFHVNGFAMSISAVVSDNEGQSIELVQHTPKRDKGPVSTPGKVRLAPKPTQSQQQQTRQALGMYPPVEATSLSQPSPFDPRSTLQRGTFDSQGFSQPPPPVPAAFECTFERIQFKQATANNGKRRAQQQFYLLLVELWADVGSTATGETEWIRVAYKKSSKMIVRGRSPGHYQNESRRGSSTSGGGSGGGLGFGAPGMMGGDFTGAPGMLASNFPGHGAFDGHGGGSQFPPNSRHGQEADPIMTQDDSKGMHDPKDYHYYPSLIYENGPHVEMFQHPTSREQSQVTSTSGDGHGAADHQVSKPVKHEYEGTLPSMFYPGSQWNSSGHCGRYESKHTSSGFYPTLPPAPGLNMT